MCIFIGNIFRVYSGCIPDTCLYVYLHTHTQIHIVERALSPENTYICTHANTRISTYIYLYICRKESSLHNMHLNMYMKTCIYIYVGI